MKRLIAVAVLAAGTLALPATARPARAGVSFRYFSGNVTGCGNFGGFYGHRSLRYFGRRYYPFRRHGYRSRYRLGGARHFSRLGFRPAHYWWSGGYYSPSYSSRYGRYYNGGYSRYYVYPEPPVYQEPIVVRRYWPAAPVVTETRVIIRTESTAAPQKVVVTRSSGSWAANQWRVSQESRRVMNDVRVALSDKSPEQPSERQSAKPPAHRPTAVYLEGETEYLLMLRRGDDGQREKAAKKLKRFATPRVIEALIEALTRDGEDKVRQEAAKSLGAMLARKALPALLRAGREDKDRSVRREARQAAQKIEAFYN